MWNFRYLSRFGKHRRWNFLEKLGFEFGNKLFFLLNFANTRIEKLFARLGLCLFVNSCQHLELFNIHTLWTSSHTFLECFFKFSAIIHQFRFGYQSCVVHSLNEEFIFQVWQFQKLVSESVTFLEMLLDGFKLNEIWATKRAAKTWWVYFIGLVQWLHFFRIIII